MTNTLITEAALMDSSLYKAFNKGQARLTSTVLAAIKEGIRIDRSYIQEQILLIERTKVSVLVDSVLHALDTGKIELLYTTNVRVPNALPFTVAKLPNGKSKAYIFISTYGTLSKASDGTEFLNVTMKDLYALMEAAYIALRYAQNPELIQKKLGLMRVSTELYTSIIVNLLNGQKALSMDPAAYDKVSFCVAKFFLERVWMSKNEEINFTYAKGANPSTRGANVLELQVLNDDYDNAKIETFTDLIKFVSTVTTRLSDMSVHYFVDSYIRMYKPAATFGLEVLPYFLFMITSSLIGSFIVRADIITDVAKRVRGMNKFYPELVRSVD